jgi:general secretion pathway protein D
MKKYPAARMRHSTLLLVGVLGVLALAVPRNVEASSASEKIRLMADTLRARDSGDLDLAKASAEELIKVAPKDENVQRLLAAINRELNQRGPVVSMAAAASPVYGQASDLAVETAMTVPVTPVAADTSSADSIVVAAAADQDTKIIAAKSAIDDAAELAKLGAFTEANNLLSTASASLVLNTATAKTLKQLEDAKADIVLVEARALADAGDLKGAELKIEAYRAAGGTSRVASNLGRRLDREISDPYNIDINDVSPDWI